MAAPHSNMDSMDDMFAGDGGFDFGASLDFLNRWNSDQQQLTLPNAASPAPVIWNAQPASGQGRVAYSQPQLTLPAFAGLASVTWNFQPALGQAMYSQPIPGTVFTIFSNLSREIQIMILKYVFKNPNLLRLKRDGSFHFSTEANGLFYLNQATGDIQTGLIYRQNVFTCPYSHSIPDLLRYSSEVTTNVLHITIPLKILAQRRVHELRSLPNLKTVRIEGYASAYDPDFALKIDTLDTILRQQKIKSAVKTMLNKSAVRGANTHPRFDAKKPEVKQLMNVRKVEVSFVAKYHVDNWDIYGLLHFETVFKIKLLDSAEGYELEMLSDERV